MRRWLIALVLVLVAALGTAAYVRQPAPRSALGDAVGVRRSRPFNRFCSWFVRDTRLGEYPTGEAVCAWYRPASAERRAELDQLKYHVLTRRVRHAARSWEPLSEQAWRRDLDSIRTALRAQGGAPSCARRSKRTDSDVREYWRFPAFEVLLFTGRDTLPLADAAGAGPRWFLFLHSVPSHPCRDAKALQRRLPNDVEAVGREDSGSRWVEWLDSAAHRPVRSAWTGR